MKKLCNHLTSNTCKSNEFGYVNTQSDETKTQQNITRAKRRHEEIADEKLLPLTIMAPVNVHDDIKFFAEQPSEIIKGMVEKIKAMLL